MSSSLPLLQGLPTPMECCSKCGQKLPRLFKHNLNRGLINFLWHLRKAGRPTKLLDLHVDNATFANAQKTRYFALAHSESGQWSLTERGLLFLGNMIEVEQHVFTRDAKVVERSANKIRISDIDEGWQDKYWYSENAKAVNE